MSRVVDVVGYTTPDSDRLAYVINTLWRIDH